MKKETLWVHRVVCMERKKMGGQLGVILDVHYGTSVLEEEAIKRYAWLLIATLRA